MALYRKASVYLRNGQLWRKSGQVILDEVRQRAAKAREERLREQQEAQKELADLRAGVELAKTHRRPKTSG